MSLLKSRLLRFAIEIKATNNNGLMIIAGCGTYTYTTVDDFLVNLREFLINPNMLERQHNRNVTAVHLAMNVNRQRPPNELLV
jgi:hypothetical protein